MNTLRRMFRLQERLFMAAICVLIFSSIPAIAQRRVLPLEPDDAIGTRQLLRESPIDLSPDGEWVAYTVQVPKREPDSGTFSRIGLSTRIGNCEVWITKVKSGETLKLTQPTGSSWSPVWSPDGKLLAFFSDRDGSARIWLWQRTDGEIRRLSDVIVRPKWGYQVARWSADGRYLLVRTLHEHTLRKTKAFRTSSKDNQNSPEADLLNSSVKVFEWTASENVIDSSNTAKPGVTKFDQNAPDYSDLTLIDIATGKNQRVVQGEFPVNYWFSPQGNRIAYLSKIGYETGNIYSARFNLVVVMLPDGEPRVIARNINHDPNFNSVSWSPDGTRLCFADQKGNVFIASAGGEEVRKTSIPASFLRWGGVHRAPLWDKAGPFVYWMAREHVWKINVDNGAATIMASFQGKTVVDVLSSSIGQRFWSPDEGRSLIAVTRDEASQQMAFHSVNLGSGDTSVLRQEDKLFADRHSAGTAWCFDSSEDAKSVVFVSENSQNPQDIWSGDSRFQNVRRITQLNPQLEAYVFGQTRVIEWYDLDGRRLHGALLLPAGFEPGKKYPLVVHLYGDALVSRYATTFGGLPGSGPFNLQMLATRGYAVLYPDAPLNVGTPMSDLAKTVLPGVNKAIELGIVDPNRLAVMGQSYGGYSALSLVVQTKRFRAAIIEAGYGNVIGSYGYLGKDGQEHFFIGFNETQNGKMGGTLWDYRERYIENSPIFYLDRVETPVLLIHGTADDGVRVFQAEEIFVGLHRLGKTVTLVEYEGEGHRLSRRANIIDEWERIFKWLEKYLGKTQ